jgi:cell division protein FtsQ
MKKIIIISLWTLLFAAIVFVIIYVSSRHKNLKCSAVDIAITNRNDVGFVNIADIQQILNGLGDPLKGRNISDIDEKLIEKKILENPYISSAEVYTTNDGTIKFRINQRIPLIRVINSAGKSYYLDTDGMMMPLSSKFTPRIIIAHGNITNPYSPSQKLINIKNNMKIDTNNLTALQRVYFLGKYIYKSDFWKDMIDQIYVRADGDLELYLSIANQSVIFGGIENMDEKFEKLLEFYKQKMAKGIWLKYKSINLKYKNQVVCTKQ